MNLIDRVIAKFGPEDSEQYTVIQYLDILSMKYPLKYTSIPNSTWTKSIEQRTRNTLLGLRPGLGDLLIAYPGKWVISIEMKRAHIKGQPRGVLSPEQKSWIEVLGSIPNVEAVKCEGASEAINYLNELLGIPTSSTKLDKLQRDNSMF